MVGNDGIYISISTTGVVDTYFRLNRKYEPVKRRLKINMGIELNRLLCLI